MKKIALLLAVVMLLMMPASAMADVAKGDRGEEVRFLQWLLQKTGWLNEKPDGIFGGHTQQAVMDYQKSKGYEETGVADAALIEQLDRERVQQDKQTHGQDYYEPYPGSYVPPYATDFTAPFHCQTSVLEDMAYRRFCERHCELLNQEALLTQSGEAEGYSEAAGLWLAEIETMYGEFADSEPAKRAAIEAAWTAWQQCFEAQQQALAASVSDPARIQRQWLEMVKNCAGTLCELRSGDAPAAIDDATRLKVAPGEPEEGMPEVELEVPAACRQWSINRGCEFFTGCEAHAPLFGQETAYLAGEAADGAALSALSAAWDGALSALYDRWEAGCPTEAVEQVQSARASFESALALQDALPLAGDAATLGHIGVVQLECIRLCALTNE